MLYLNGKPVEFGQFPNKEINLPIKELDIKEVNVITFEYVDDSDIFKLALLKHYLDEMAAKTELYVTYMPYSRMDRVNGTYAITLQVMAKLINDMNFSRVDIREPHSIETTKLVKNCWVDWWVAHRIETVVKLSETNTLFFPDDGAQQRYNMDGLDIPYAVGTKKRNFDSGNIMTYDIKGEVGHSVLIVDDLCSRGGTFIKAAKLLREQGATYISLLVAHCENNVFTGDVFDYIDRIYTSKEMLDKNHPRITKMD